MKHTKNETQTKTLTRLIGALDKQHPVTITYTKADSSVTIRTIEIHDFKVSAAGDILIAAMDRETGERRDFRLDRIQTYTIHRTSYTVSRWTHAASIPVKRHTTPGLAALNVVYPINAPIAERIALLADHLAA